jgi:hypothetical protein
MTGSTRWLAAAAVLALAGPAAAAPDAPDARLPFPAKAPLVLHVHGIERTKDRLIKMLAALPPAEAQAVKQLIDGGFSQLLTGRKLTAVPRDGRLFVVSHDLTRLGEVPPPLSVLVPVTEYKAFRESFLTEAERKSFEPGDGKIDSLRSPIFGDEARVYVVNLKGYLALTLDRATAEEYAGNYARADATALGPELAASFLDADVALYANMAVINETHRGDIRDYKELIDFSLKQAEMNDMLPPGLDRRQLAAARVLVAGLFQGIEDCRGLVLAAEFRPDGLNLRAQARFADDTATAKLLRPERPTPLADLGRLPAGLGTYSATRFGPATAPLTRLLNQTFQAAPDDEAGAARLARLEAEIVAAGPGAEFAAHGSGADLIVTDYDDPRKAVAAETALYAGLAPPARVNSVVLKEKPRVTPAAQTHRGFECAEVRLAYDFEATAAGLPELSRGPYLALLRRMTPEKAVFWIGTDGKRVVRVGAADWPAARKLLDVYLDGKGGVGAEPGFQLTRTNLPADATYVGMYETGYVITTLLDYYRELAKELPGDLPEIGPVKPPPGPPTYLGVALTLRPQSATVDVFIPGGSMNTAVRMLAPVFKQFD